MKAIKKINNNVAICLDVNNKEVVAFGKGIGFPSMPYEVSLNNIDMTFYRLDARLHALLNEIPEDVFMVTSLIVKEAQKILNVNLNPNILFSLADHINFAIVRLKKYKKLKMIYSFDIAQMYPKETEIGKMAINLIQKHLFVTMPDAEITNIAIHFVNSQDEIIDNDDVLDEDILILNLTNIIESYFSVEICKDGFYYNRFVTHLRYYIRRIQENKQFDESNIALVDLLKKQQPKIYNCSCLVSEYINEQLKVKNTENELLYLIIHIDRVINKSQEGGN